MTTETGINVSEDSDWKNQPAGTGQGIIRALAGLLGGDSEIEEEVIVSPDFSA